MLVRQLLSSPVRILVDYKDVHNKEKKGGRAPSIRHGSGSNGLADALETHDVVGVYVVCPVNSHTIEPSRNHSVPV